MKIQAYFVLFAVLAAIGYCAFTISRTIYQKLKKKENKYAIVFGVITFIVSYAIIISIIAFMLSKVLYFGR
jgi:hypothetical protein